MKRYSLLISLSLSLCPLSLFDTSEIVIFILQEQLYCRSILLPGSDIPKWFTFQNIGPSIALQLPEHCLINLIGFALCAVIDFEHRPSNSRDSLYINCGIHIKMNKAEDLAFNCFLASIRDAIDSDHVILGFSPLGIGGFPVGGGNHNTAVMVNFFPAKVKCCGVSPVYADANKTDPKNFTLKFATEIGKLDDKLAKLKAIKASTAETSTGFDMPD